MKTDQTRIACIECDLTVTIDPLEGGQRAKYPRCDHLLTAPTEDLATKSLALVLTAAMLLLAPNLFPLLSLQASGLDLKVARAAWRASCSV